MVRRNSTNQKSSSQFSIILLTAAPLVQCSQACAKKAAHELNHRCTTFVTEEAAQKKAKEAAAAKAAEAAAAQKKAEEAAAAKKAAEVAAAQKKAEEAAAAKKADEARLLRWKTDRIDILVQVSDRINDAEKTLVAAMSEGQSLPTAADVGKAASFPVASHAFTSAHTVVITALHERLPVVSQLKQEVTAFDEQRTAMWRELTEVAARRGHIEDDVAQLSAQISQLQTKILEKKREAKEHAGTLKAYEEQYAAIAERADKVRDTLGPLDTVATRLREAASVADTEAKNAAAVWDDWCDTLTTAGLAALNIADTMQLVHGAGLKNHADAFYKQKISGAMLAALSQDKHPLEETLADPAQVGVTDVCNRRRLQWLIRCLGSADSTVRGVAVSVLRSGHDNQTATIESPHPGFWDTEVVTSFMRKRESSSEAIASIQQYYIDGPAFIELDDADLATFGLVAGDRFHVKQSIAAAQLLFPFAAVAHAGATGAGAGAGAGGAVIAPPTSPQSVAPEVASVCARVLDVAEEDLEIRTALEGIAEQPILPFAESVELLSGVMDSKRIKEYIYLATKAGKQKVRSVGDKCPLSPDQAAVIFFYTMETPFYKLLNSALRDRDRRALRPYWAILKLLLTSLRLLHAEERTVYRGVKVSLHGKYRAAMTNDPDIFWWAFSSTTGDKDVLTSEQFCGQSGPRTMFRIKSIECYNIRDYSAVPNEAEFLLLPCAHMTITDVEELSAVAPGLVWVTLQQSKSPLDLLTC